MNTQVKKYLDSTNVRKSSDSFARKEARRLGLKYHGWGYWGTSTEITHKTEDGKLVRLENSIQPTEKQNFGHFPTGRKDTKIPTVTDTQTLRDGSVEDSLTYTNKEFKELYSYLSSSIVQNLFLVDGKNKTEKIQERIATLDSLFSKSKLAADATLYRGIATPQGIDYFKNLMKNKTEIEVPIFLSTSLSPNVANRFTTYEQKFIMIIKAKKGQSGLVISPELVEMGNVEKDDLDFIKDVAKAEFEVILPRNTKLRIVRIEKWKRDFTNPRTKKVWKTDKHVRIIAEVV